VTPEHWKRVAELFEAAIEQQPAARADFLAKAAAGDAALAEEVLRLLASDENAGTFLNRPAGLSTSSASDGRLAAWHQSLRKENPSLATDLQVLLQERYARGDEGFLSTEPAALPTPAALIGQRVGAYTLESPIGQGGMGTVWLARRSDGRFEGRAAVKFLNLGLLGGAGEQRFKREGSILSRLAHPNIAHLIDAGVSPAGQPYLILEYVEGKHIDAYCNEHALDIEARIRLFLDVLAAVAHAHANLIVHRDIKPSNVLVTEDGQVKLLDFGIAKLLEDETSTSAATVLTRQGERALTLAYAAPEQVTGSAITTGTDVYALGVLLYQLLTGKHPAESALQSPAHLMKAIVDTKPPRPSETLGPTSKLSRELRGDLDTIVGKSLKKNPAERYASATAFADDLRRYLGHEPISARPDTLAYRAKKFVRRNRLAVALASAAFVATVAGVIGTAIQARTARRERDIAISQLARAEAIDDFNTVVLGEGVPWGKQVTIGDLLGQAESLIEARSDVDNAKRAELLMSVASHYRTNDEYGPARRLLEQAASLARSSPNPSTRARASCALGHVLVIQGFDQLPRAESLIQAGLEELPADAAFALDRVYCLHAGAFIRWVMGHSADALARAQLAQRALRQAPFQPALLELGNLVLLGMCYSSLRRMRDALATLEQASELIRSQGLGNTQWAGGVFYRWGLALWQFGRPLDAEPMLNRSAQIAQRGRAERVTERLLIFSYANVLETLGRLDEAANYAERLQAQTQSERNILWGLAARAKIYRKQGNLERAAQMLSELEPRLRENFPPGDITAGHITWARLAAERALIAKARGENAAALDFANQALTTAEAVVKDFPVHTTEVQSMLVMRSELQLDLGHVDEAMGDARRALAVAVDETPPEMFTMYLGYAYLALGRALQAQGKREEAQAAFRSAVKHLQSALGPDHADTQTARHLAEGVVQPR
jgi:serine/threonine-protein kinase